MMLDNVFWKNKRVFLTGHTGFKGSWMCLVLHALGAQITGYALAPQTKPNLFELCSLESVLHKHICADIRKKEDITKAVMEARPEIVIHMAAQPLVGMSYLDPLTTYETNVMGTVHVLEAVRRAALAQVPIRTVINVTTDKCYENKEWPWGYREVDTLGGHDPYSNSKACSELVTASYRQSFFQSDASGGKLGIATARAGNVIGGGDWTFGRLIPDLIQSLLNKDKVVLRNPQAIRPWQHVLESVCGYLLLAEKLWEDPRRYSSSWNFGPDPGDAKTVEWITARMCEKWGAQASYQITSDSPFHEATYLKLDCAKAITQLGWHPRWSLEQALDAIMEWTRAYQQKKDMKEVCLEQIDHYLKEGAS